MNDIIDGTAMDELLRRSILDGFGTHIESFHILLHLHSNTFVVEECPFQLTLGRASDNSVIYVGEFDAAVVLHGVNCKYYRYSLVSSRPSLESEYEVQGARVWGMKSGCQSCISIYRYTCQYTKHIRPRRPTY